MWFSEFLPMLKFANTLLNNVTDKLKEEDKNALEITITELEVKNAIFAAKENKSPGKMA